MSQPGERGAQVRMDAARLSDEEKGTLLRLAREALEGSVRGQRLQAMDLSGLPAILRAHGASFVTLTVDGDLRGCVGTLVARLPLAQDVREQAVSAALQDHRFSPVQERELERIRIEISRLTPPVALEYSTPDDLRARLRPDVDGVILHYGARRATYLPQVWKKLPDPDAFLGSLCEKMGTEPEFWQHVPLGVETYEVEEFHEQRDL